MKTILTQLGIGVSDKKESETYSKLELLYINNPDGSIRWFWPSHVTKPLFLKFYNMSGLKSKVVTILMKLLFFLKLQKIILKKKVLFYDSGKANTASFSMKNQWAIFTGTTGPNNKAIMVSQATSGFVFTKIALTENAKNLIQKEARVLSKLRMSTIHSFVVPKVITVQSNSIQLSDVSKNGRRIQEITDAHIHSLIELNELSSTKAALNEVSGWSNLKELLNQISIKQDERLPKGLIKKLKLLLNTIDENESLEFCLSHGDFTPWNMFYSKNQLKIYDWELADFSKPLGFDFFHFLIQQGVLVERNNWKEIKIKIDSAIGRKQFSQLSKQGGSDIEKYLKLYLIYNSIYYLHIYSNQEEWHKQIYWQINLWNEAISSLLSTSIPKRELIILDVFDFLLPKNYGAIKFSNMSPNELSENSDIDLLMSKLTEKELEVFLNNHPLVKQSHAMNKSYMSTLQLFTNDGGILSIDVLYKFKRRELEFLNAKEILTRVYTNQFGVKMLNVYDNTRYIGLFYALNDALITSKYSYYEEILNKSKNAVDTHIYPYFLDEKCSNENLFKFIKQQKQNRGLKGLVNKFSYIIDTFRTMMMNEGMVLTFSGVDGAGKSTVIEKLKVKLEKQLRRRVIVLRHRPSLLPILSSYVKGQKQAEFDAANTLPRQGKNSSFFSSALRFSYYYLDYLFGQFVIYFKYKLRGYVVIYDRYYFDFISDSKRSNIKLPVFIMKFGFNFLMKPKFNFFLYADPEVILNRKKELDKNTIINLTNNYQKQFNDLNRKNSDAHYISIKNENLDNTLAVIFENLVSYAA